MSTLYRSLRISILSIASLVFLLFFSVLWLLATQTGSRFLLTTLSDELEQLQIEQINGALLGNLQLKNLRYSDGADFSVEIAALTLNWHPWALSKGHLHIANFNIKQISISGKPQGEQESSDSTEIPLIPIDISVDTFIVDQFSWKDGESITDIQHFDASASLVNNKLEITTLSLKMLPLQASGKSTLTLQSDWPVIAELNWAYTFEKAPLQGQLNINGNLQKMDFSSVIAGSIASTQTGVLHLDLAEPAFEISGNWQKLQWPLSGTPQISSRQGTVTIKGTASNYHAQLNAILSPPDYPDFSANLNASGNTESIQISQLKLKEKKGELLLKGSLGWKDGISFGLDVNAKQINPQAFGAPVPGNLSATLQSSGKIVDETIDVALDLQQLKGQLYDQKVNANGKIQLVNDTVHLQPLHILAGNNKLYAKGQFSQQKANIKINIAAPDLKTAWPTLSGKLNGDINIKGPLLKPTFKSSLQGNDIRYADYRLKQLDLEADYIHASSRPSSLDFVISGLELADTKLDQVRIHSQGTQTKHSLQAQIDSTLLAALFNSHGSWNGTQWQGQIDQLDINHPQLQQWQLRAPANLTLKPTNDSILIDLPETCLQQDPALMCFEATGDPQQHLNGHLTLSDWSLQHLKIWLPPEVSLAGNLLVNSTFSLSPKNTSAILNATIKDGQATVNDDENIKHTLILADSKLEANYQHDQLQSQFYLGLTEKDYISATLNAGQAQGADAIRKLNGAIDASITDMTFIDGTVSAISKLKGEIKGNLVIAGTSANPLLTGTLQLQDSSFAVKTLGTTISKVNLDIHNSPEQPEHLLISAEMESGKGKMTSTGHLDLLPQNNFPMQLTLNGEKFMLSRLPEAEVTISPRISLSKFDKLTKIGGEISIDSAKVEIKTIPENVIAPSEDEIIITADQKSTKPIDPERTNINVIILLGEDIHFAGFGLDSKLAGKLQYVVNQDKQSLQGKAEMRKATYKAYGQDLNLRRGEFLFNGPADNPWMNIEAERKAKSDNVTAILSVTGPLKDPYTRIYTEPALPESEALAYLVTGNSLKRMNQGDSNAVANAAFSYGAGQLSWISDQLGIDEFEFEESDNIEDSAVRLGQYLNPDLYVGVTMGLFASRYAANLRYRLTEHFSLRTRAGETQRIDLKYHIATE
jgi:translocation and assembly module TamB